MTRRPPPEVSVLRDRGHRYWSAPRGRWLVAGTEGAIYPCMCQGRRPCEPVPAEYPWLGCPCAGRTDLDVMPANCCARRVQRVTRGAAA